MRTLNDLTHYGWLKLMPRRMLQNTRDDIDRRWSQASEQLRKFQASNRLIDGKLHTVPSQEGERVALAAVQRAWDSAAPFMERDEVQGFTRVMTQLCSSRPFDDYSVPIRSLIGKLEAETAAHLDEAPARPEPLKPPSTQPELKEPAPEQDTEESRAKARQAFVQPILEKQSLSMNQWATLAGSTYNTVRDYMNGVTITLRASTRTQLAAPLRIDRENLP